MKKYLLFIVAVLFLSQFALAQETVNQEGKEKDKVQNKEQKTDKTRKSNHGYEVSTVAKETTSGPGKGETVSTVAKTQGEANKNLRNSKKGKDKNMGKEMAGTARSIHLNQNARNTNTSHGASAIMNVNKGLGHK